MLTKRLREWYSLYNPELSYDEKYVEKVLGKSNKVKNSMGKDLSDKDMDSIMNLAEEIQVLIKYKEKTSSYLEKIMEKYCPNLNSVAGMVIGAKLLAHTGSLKRLVMMPASTIQILGAEKALFRHLKSGAKPPRHGIIVNHSLISEAKQKDHGKRARALADKISIAVKIDYFKGKFIGDKLRKELEEKFR